MRKFFPFVVVCLALFAITPVRDSVMAELVPAIVMAQSADDVCVASTPSGQVRGLHRGAACTYLGVPYVVPPVGNLRWKPPQPKAPWAPAVLDAVSPPPVCAQLSTVSVPPGALSGSEDCLMLNIWAPARPRSGRAPVIVWFHTGGFTETSANFAASNGERFAQEENVIIVAPNYRLGPFGFLAHSALTLEDPAYRSSGNYGLLDQRAALAWVRDHIAAFGGDARNITIAGTSAGSQSVSLHLVSPGSAGLFHRAIMQSGIASARWTNAAEAEAQGDQFARALECPDVRTAAGCLRSKTRDQVLRALPTDRLQILERAALWSPSVDGLEISDQPRELYQRGQFTRVPLIMGVNKDEGWPFVDRSFPTGLTASDYAAAVIHEFGFDGLAILERYPAAQYPTPKDALARLTGDAEYVCETRRIARLVQKTGTTVYLYSFEHSVETLSDGRSIHGIESNFLFGNNFGAPSNHVLTSADLALFSTMSKYWARFAEIGTPNARGNAVLWPRFTPDKYLRLSDRYLVLDTTLGEANHLRDEYCNFWEHYFFRSLIGAVPASRP